MITQRLFRKVWLTPSAYSMCVTPHQKRVAQSIYQNATTQQDCESVLPRKNPLPEWAVTALNKWADTKDAECAPCKIDREKLFNSIS